MAGGDGLASKMSGGKRLSKTLASWLVIALWPPYVALNTIFPGPLMTYALGLALALLGLTMLWLAGVPLRAIYVRLAPLSPQGALLLLVLMLALPAAFIAGRLQPWNTLDNLVYAPASALAQELYFRAGLLVALTTVFRGRQFVALVAQGVLFGLWHIRAFAVVPLASAIGVILATTIAGLIWGREAQRDGTMIYAAAQHTLFLILF
jgi:membrane protease YdiL (CAAX protease family)